MGIQIARNGDLIGEFTAEQLNEAVTRGNVLKEDFAWYEGLTDWITVGELLITLQPKLDVIPDQAPKGQTKPKPVKSTKQPKQKPEAKPKHDWRTDPASEKQLNYLASFGVTPKICITKGEASDLIDKCTTDPSALERQERIREAKFEEKRLERAMFPSYNLRIEMASASKDLERIKNDREKAKAKLSADIKELTDFQKKLAQTTNEEEKDDLQSRIDDIKAEIETDEAELSDFPGDLKDAQEELKSRQSLRIGFWKATFKPDWIEADDEMNLIDFADTIDRLYTDYGSYFKVPTNKQIADILAALDEASPDWDKEQTHSFYATLKASFPDCIKKSVQSGRSPASFVRRSASPRKQGCLVLVSALIFIYYFVTHAK